MASPLPNGAPSTPPPSDPASSSNQALPLDPDIPLTSLSDDGLSKRPRDARLIHLVLSSLGIHSYQERVPLQLLDFAYRYTSSVLSDSLRLAAEGYAGSTNDGTRGGGNRSKATSGATAAAGGAGDGGDGNITVTALRQAIASRTGYQFAGPLPKEFMMEQAAERNRIALPKVDARGAGGLQLPPEKYCLTGVGWGLREEWDEEDVPLRNGDAATAAGGVRQKDQRMGGMDGANEEEEDDEAGVDEEGAGRMEDVFGEDEGTGVGGDEDTNMGND